MLFRSACDIPGLAAGLVALTVSASTIRTTTSTIAINSSGSATQLFTVDLDVDLASLSGTIDIGGTPVVGALITLTLNGSSPAIVRSSSTNANGDYYFEQLQPGSWSIRVSAVGYATQTSTVLLSESGAETKDFTLVASPGSLTLTITTLGGTSLDGITASVYTSSSKTTLVTSDVSDSTSTPGTAAIDGLSPGQYWVVVSDSIVPARFSTLEFLVKIGRAHV